MILSHAAFLIYSHSFSHIYLPSLPPPCREKEKELIKKKLKASKDFKDKKSPPPPSIQEAVPIKSGGGKSGKKGGNNKVIAGEEDDDAELDEMTRELDLKKGECCVAVSEVGLWFC